MIEILLIFLVNLIYLPGLWYGLITDDEAYHKRVPFNVRRGRIFNQTLHIMVCEYIYMAFGCTPQSFMAAILFAVHPQVVQVPVWIAGRQYGLNALMMLFTITFLPWGGAILFGCINGISPSILFIPLFFLFTKFWYMAPVCIGILLWRTWPNIKQNLTVKVHGDGVYNEALPKDFDLNKWNPLKPILAAKCLWFYFLSVFAPIKSGFYNSWMVTVGAAKNQTAYWYSPNRHFWGGIIVLMGLLITCVYHRSNAIGLGIAVFLLSIGPFLNFITIQQYTSPRFAYLATGGLLVAFCHLLPWHIGICIFPGLFALYLVKLIDVLRVYRKNNMTLMELDSQTFPDNPRLWYFRYEHMLHKGNPVMAFAEATYGLKHNPDDCQLYFGLAVACHMMGKLKDAGLFLDMAEKYMITAERETMKELILEFRRRIAEEIFKIKGGGDVGKD